MQERSNNAILIENARSGSPEAIAELYARHVHALYRIGYRLLGTREDAEDLVQDVFVGLPTALSNYDHRDRFEPWIMTLATRTALMASRAARRRREVALPDAPVVASRVEAPGIVDRIALERALQELPELQREVFILRVMEGYAHDEIGGLVGVSPASSRLALHRARKRLAHALRGGP